MVRGPNGRRHRYVSRIRRRRRGLQRGGVLPMLHDEIHTTLKFTTGRKFQFPVF